MVSAWAFSVVAKCDRMVGRRMGGTVKTSKEERTTFEARRLVCVCVVVVNRGLVCGVWCVVCGLWCGVVWWFGG